MTTEEIKNKILPVLISHGASRVGLFGSAARGEMKADSDVDIVVAIEKKISLLEFVGIKQKLEELLGRNVDLIEYEEIKPVLRESIMRNHIVLL